MLSHVDKDGNAAMVDVSHKSASYRKAIAGGSIFVGKKVFALIKENEIKKGDVLGTAKIAGILAAKKVGDLIPLCHPLNLSYIDVTFQYDERDSRIIIFGTVSVNALTGVEMEALTAVNVAALTIYDMCKGVDKEIVIGESFLIKKIGGKSGLFRNKRRISGYFLQDTIIDKDHPKMTNPLYNNILRHSGAIISLIKGFELTKETIYLSKANDAIKFLLTTFKHHIYDGEYICYPF